MGMPVTVEIVDAAATSGETDTIIREVFDYFKYIDEKFSTYKTTSEITAINDGRLASNKASNDMKTVFALAEETRLLTDGYFDIKRPDGTYDPSGLVKGWAIWNAAKLIAAHGCKHFYVDAGGDIQTSGMNAEGKKWAVGIKNPWNEAENVKVVYLSGEGIATSGTYIRGDHIYNPKTGVAADDIASMTVIGPNIYEADRLATAAFAMGKNGIAFLERRAGEGANSSGGKSIRGYMIDKNKIATMTTQWQ